MEIHVVIHGENTSATQNELGGFWGKFNTRDFHYLCSLILLWWIFYYHKENSKHYGACLSQQCHEHVDVVCMRANFLLVLPLFLSSTEYEIFERAWLERQKRTRKKFILSSTLMLRRVKFSISAVDQPQVNINLKVSRKKYISIFFIFLKTFFNVFIFTSLD